MVKLLHAAGHRGHPRRRLQPHRRGQDRIGPDAVAGAASTTRPTTGSTSAAAVHRRHRLRQHPRPPPPARAAAWSSTRCATGCRSCTSTASGSTSPCALGRGQHDDFDPDHPFLVALRTDPVLSRREAHRRAVGPRHARLAHRRSSRRRGSSGTTGSATPCGVLAERRAGRARAPHGVRTSRRGSPGRATCSADAAAGRTPRSTSSPPTTASRCATSSSYDAQAQRGQRRGQPRRHRRQPLVEPRRRGPDRRPGASSPAAPRSDAQPAGHAAALARACRCSLAGDELGRTQHGNNNAYCQDNEISWLDWDLAPWQAGPPRDDAAPGARAPGAAGAASGFWATGARCTRTAAGTSSGTPPTARRWATGGTTPISGSSRCTSRGLDGHRAALVVVNGGPAEIEVTLPAARGVTAYRLLWDSAWTRPRATAERTGRGTVTVPGTSLRVYAASDDADPPGVARGPRPTSAGRRPRLARGGAAAPSAARSGWVPPRPSAPVGSTTA